jgi:hypothetical protein
MIHLPFQQVNHRSRQPKTPGVGFPVRCSRSCFHENGDEALETDLETAVAAACYRIAKVVIRKRRANAP